MFFFTDNNFFCKNRKNIKAYSNKKNLKHSAVNGSLLSTIGFVVIKAEDQSNIKAKGNNLII